MNPVPLPSASSCPGWWMEDKLYRLETIQSGKGYQSNLFIIKIEETESKMGIEGMQTHCELDTHLRQELRPSDAQSIVILV